MQRHSVIGTKTFSDVVVNTVVVSTVRLIFLTSMWKLMVQKK